jgi:hypothetical protein
MNVPEPGRCCARGVSSRGSVIASDAALMAKLLRKIIVSQVEGNE